MPAVESRMLELGTPAPAFSLPDPDGRLHSLADSAPAYLVMFICNHCPFVKHVRGGFATLAREYQDRGVAVVGISSNDFVAHPDDSPSAMAEEVRAVGYTFPYLVDETQEVAKAYRAACTPDFFLFDQDFRLVYRGQMDGSRPDNDLPVTGRDIRAAVNNLLAGDPVQTEQIPSMGCNIKWKKGSEPDYFA